MIKKIMIIVVPIYLILSGCSIMTPAPQAAGSSLQMVPVKQSLSLNADAEHMAQSKQKLERFIQQMGEDALTQRVALTWYSKDGDTLKQFAYDSLTRVGVSPSNIVTQDLSILYDPLQRFDFTLSLVDYQVKTADCPANRVDDYYGAGNGCFLESARWKSMVRPERMLQKQLDMTTE